MDDDSPQANQLHLVFFPFMAQGHMIPMIDISKLLATRGILITIITTPTNAARFEQSLARANNTPRVHINLVKVPFPCTESGLPEGCENFDMLPSLDLVLNFLTAANMLGQHVEKLFETLTPPPNCIISDVCLPYTGEIARKFSIPRIVFHGGCCFSLLCFLKLYIPQVIETIASGSNPIVLPDFPDKIEFSKHQLPSNVDPNLTEFYERMVKEDLASRGVIANTFEELEPQYVKEYRKSREAKVWCVGPVSLCNIDELDMAQRGYNGNASIDEEQRQCLKWLDKQDPCSVIYVCLGSQWNLPSPQLIELGLGLVESGRPFIWVVRKAEELLDKGLEERIKERGILIHCWAPQVLILSHKAIGGFITHCGWNSTLEGVTAGVPLITWPLSGDQFCNEKLVTQVVKIAVRVGVEEPLKWEEEERIEVLVKREDVRNAIESLMDSRDEGRERREKARQVAELAKRAVVEGGSSYRNITQLIRDIEQSSSSSK